MDAQALTCPQCGAAAESDATSCAFCHARLSTVPCAACFGLVFLGSKHCGHCGATMASPDSVADSPHACPRGCGPLRAIALGGIDLEECGVCAGLWLDDEVFRRLYAEEERGAVALAPAVLKHQVKASAVETVRYVPCPVCAKVMNRINFAKRSGVILDSCAAHGTWFDADELRRVVEFVRSGGMDQLRRKERMFLAEERRFLDVKRSFGEGPVQGAMTRDNWGSPLRTSALESMLALLREL